MTNEELVHAYQNGDMKALEELIIQNKNIVYKLANKFYIENTNSIDKEDLQQEGFTGIIIAAKRYDFNNPKKCLFITYAAYWIYQKMHYFIIHKNTNDEISLNTPINSKDDDLTLIDSIKDDKNEYENVEERLYINQLHQELNDAMNKYDTLKEREVLKLHYGWDNNKAMSCADIGDMLNTTGQKVINIENRACRKIRDSVWGHKKAMEIGTIKNADSYDSIMSRIDYLDFEDEYL